MVRTAAWRQRLLFVRRAAAQEHKPHTPSFLCCHAVMGTAAPCASGFCTWRADMFSPWVCAQQLQAPALHCLARALSQAVVACNNIVHALLLQHAAGQGNKGQAAPGHGPGRKHMVSAHTAAGIAATCAVLHGSCDGRVQAATSSMQLPHDQHASGGCAASKPAALTDLMLSFRPYSMARLGVYGVLPAGLVFSWSMKS